MSELSVNVITPEAVGGQVSCGALAYEGPAIPGQPVEPTVHDAIYSASQQGGGGGVTLADAAPPAIAAASALGSSVEAAREDHTHAHGNLAGGNNHAVATGAAAGFMSATDKAKLDGIPSGGGGDGTVVEYATRTISGERLVVGVLGAVGDAATVAAAASKPSSDKWSVAALPVGARLLSATAHFSGGNVTSGGVNLETPDATGAATLAELSYPQVNAYSDSTGVRQSSAPIQLSIPSAGRLNVLVTGLSAGVGVGLAVQP